MLIDGSQMDAGQISPHEPRHRLRRIHHHRRPIRHQVQQVHLQPGQASRQVEQTSHRLKYTAVAFQSLKVSGGGGKKRPTGEDRQGRMRPTGKGTPADWNSTTIHKIARENSNKKAPVRSL